MEFLGLILATILVQEALFEDVASFFGGLLDVETLMAVLLLQQGLLCWSQREMEQIGLPASWQLAWLLGVVDRFHLYSVELAITWAFPGFVGLCW
jgi:hypothetical protein